MPKIRNKKQKILAISTLILLILSGFVFFRTGFFQYPRWYHEMQLNLNKDEFDHVATHIDGTVRDGEPDTDSANSEDKEFLKSLKKCNYPNVYIDNRLDCVVFLPNNYVEGRGRGLVYCKNELTYFYIYDMLRYEIFEIGDNWYYFCVKTEKNRKFFTLNK